MGKMRLPVQRVASVTCAVPSAGIPLSLPWPKSFIILSGAPLAHIKAEQWVLNPTDLAPPIPEPLGLSSVAAQGGQGVWWAWLQP